MFQIVSSNKIIYQPSDNKLLTENNVNSTGDALFYYQNYVWSARSNYFQYNNGNITLDSNPYTLFSIDTSGSTVFNMQVISYQTVTNIDKPTNISYKLYTDDILHDEITLYAKMNDQCLLMFYRVYRIYKQCNNIKLTMTQNITNTLDIPRTQVHMYTLLN